jgi:hypothetical protein
MIQYSLLEICHILLHVKVKNKWIKYRRSIFWISYLLDLTSLDFFL